MSKTNSSDKQSPATRFRRSSENRKFATVFQVESRIQDVVANRGDKLFNRGSIAKYNRRESFGQRRVAKPTHKSTQKIYEALTRLSVLDVSKRDVVEKCDLTSKRVRAVSRQFQRENEDRNFARVAAPLRRVSLNKAAAPLARLQMTEASGRQRVESFGSHRSDYRYPMSTRVFEALSRLVSIREHESDDRPSIAPKSPRRKKHASDSRFRKSSFHAKVHVEPAQRRHSFTIASNVDHKRDHRYDTNSKQRRNSRHDRHYASVASPIRGFDERIRYRAQASINYSSAFDDVLRKHRNKELRAKMDLPSYPEIVSLDEVNPTRRNPRFVFWNDDRARRGFRMVKKKITTIAKRGFPLRVGLFRKVREANDAWFSSS